jgi:hypothetical protein
MLDMRVPMPEGIFIIDFDEFEGGVISIKYPDTEEFQIPNNVVQILQISHNFTPGFLTFKEENFSGLSYGNETLQKVIVLVLSKYEDSDDFKQIVRNIDQVVMENEDPEQLPVELERIFTLSQSVFRAREAVMMKMAQEIEALKNREVDLKNALRFLIQTDKSMVNKIFYQLMILGPSTPDELRHSLAFPESEFLNALHQLQTDKKVELQEDNKLHLLIYYPNM